MTARVAKRVAAECSRAAMVLVLRSYLLPLLDVVLGDASRPKLVLDVDDIESVVHRELGQADEAARFERLETHYLPLMDEVFVCSRGDAGVVSHAHVIPNAVRPPEIAAPADSTDFDLLLVGNLSYAPNVEAAGWLCHEVLPHMTGATVAILGSSPPPSVMRLADEPAITVVPDPQNVAPWYERSAVAVVPVKRGGGSRIKLIEALAHGRPVVATSTGAAGLPWSQVESPVVIADTPSDFAQACRELIDDRERARSLGDEGRKLVLARASVDVVAAQIDRLLGSTG
jgi:glycosyltransferase involved in cell wall biosynthesis